MKKWHNFLILFLVTITMIGFFVIAQYLPQGKGIGSEVPVIICVPYNVPPEQQKCFWSAHVHSKIHIFQNGNEVPLGFEQGDLDAVHTHSEKDLLHWHSVIPADPYTQEVIDWSAFRLDHIVTDVGINVRGNVRYVVNENPESESYIWKDGDQIEIYYEE